MFFSNQKIETELLETAAGRVVFDSLVQANVNLETISLESVKQMLLEECRQQSGVFGEQNAVCCR